MSYRVCFKKIDFKAPPCLLQTGYLLRCKYECSKTRSFLFISANKEREDLITKFKVRYCSQADKAPRRLLLSSSLWYNGEEMLQHYFQIMAIAGMLQCKTVWICLNMPAGSAFVLFGPFQTNYKKWRGSYPKNVWVGLLTQNPCWTQSGWTVGFDRNMRAVTLSPKGSGIRYHVKRHGQLQVCGRDSPMKHSVWLIKVVEKYGQTGNHSDLHCELPNKKWSRKLCVAFCFGWLAIATERRKAFSGSTSRGFSEKCFLWFRWFQHYRVKNNPKEC